MTKEARGKEENHAKVMQIKAKCIPHIVGKGGAMIRKIAAACHGHVALPSAKESEPEQVVTIVLHAHKEFTKVAEKMVTDIVQKYEKEAGIKHAKEMKKEMKKGMKKEIKIRAKGHLDIVVRGGIDRYAKIIDYHV